MTLQCNGWRLTCCGHHRKLRIEIPISKLIFNSPVSLNEQKIFMNVLNIKIQNDTIHNI